MTARIIINATLTGLWAFISQPITGKGPNAIQLALDTIEAAEADRLWIAQQEFFAGLRTALAIHSKP